MPDVYTMYVMCLEKTGTGCAVKHDSTKLMVNPKLPTCTDLPVCLTAGQTFAPLKNSYGAVWEGSLPATPPLDMQIASGDQTLIVR